MRSKGGKIFYRCGDCYSTDIRKEIVTGHYTGLSGTHNFYKCNTCGHMDFWQAREKQSVLEYFNSIRPLVYMRNGNNVFIESNGVTFDIKRVRVHPGMLYEKNYKTSEVGGVYYYDKAYITVDGKKYEINGGLK